MSLSEQDREDLRRLGAGERDIAAVEALIARHVTAALDEAADDLRDRASHYCTGCNSCDGNRHFAFLMAAEIVHDRAHTLPHRPT